MRRVGALLLMLLAASGTTASGQDSEPAPLPLLDVPFISQSEALCGGAAAAMVLRYWGERDVSAESFARLLEPGAEGIGTDALIGELRRRGWDAVGVRGSDDLLGRELALGHPVVTLIEDRPGIYHYIVVVAHHPRGVVFHDPARVPFRVMTAREFDRRWAAADRWMGVVAPRAPAAGVPPVPAPVLPRTSCEQLVADGVAAAQANQLDLAERTLTTAFACPDSAAPRELAGLRLLQQRWSDVDALASAAVARDAGDTYGWKLLGTARFIEDDRLGALEAWNHASEPRLDTVRIDGLTRTRHRVVERLLNVPIGETLTAAAFVRARRRLRDLPSTVSVRLEYTPAPSGIVELRGSVVERSLLPVSPLSLAALGVSAAAAREVRATLGSFTGGGEELAVAWRFWEHRRRLAVAVRAPAPWGGVWGAEGFQERQSFTSTTFADAERTGAQVTQSNWATGRVKWTLAAGLDRWQAQGTFGSVGGGLRLVSLGDRAEIRSRVNAWLGRDRFAAGGASVHLRSSNEARGLVWLATGGMDAVSALAPMDLWVAGDTGAARLTLLRAHPLLSNGRMRVSRIGRRIEHVSVEGQRWWRVAGPVRAAAALFIDAARTSRRLDAAPRRDVDAGVGARFSASGLPGLLRIDLGRGINDGATTLSFTYVVE